MSTGCSPDFRRTARVSKNFIDLVLAHGMSERRCSANSLFVSSVERSMSSVLRIPFAIEDRCVFS